MQEDILPLLQFYYYISLIFYYLGLGLLAHIS